MSYFSDERWLPQGQRRLGIGPKLQGLNVWSLCLGRRRKNYFLRAKVPSGVFWRRTARGSIYHWTLWAFWRNKWYPAAKFVSRTRGFIIIIIIIITIIIIIIKKPLLGLGTQAQSQYKERKSTFFLAKSEFGSSALVSGNEYWTHCNRSGFSRVLSSLFLGNQRRSSYAEFGGVIATSC